MLSGSVLISNLAASAFWAAGGAEGPRDMLTTCPGSLSGALARGLPGRIHPVRHPTSPWGPQDRWCPNGTGAALLLLEFGQHKELKLGAAVALPCFLGRPECVHHGLDTSPPHPLIHCPGVTNTCVRKYLIQKCINDLCSFI